MLIDTARIDGRVATALHEASHAMAYINIGREFQYISVSNAVLMPYPRMIDAWDRAVISMAGPAAEGLMNEHGRGDDAAVVSFILEQYRETMEFVALEPDAAGKSDYTEAGPHALDVVPVSLAIVSSNWLDIERIAQAALDSAEILEYVQIIDLISNKDGASIGSELRRWQQVHNQGQPAEVVTAAEKLS